ncbi:flagellar basal body P-ring protein FlgI [Desulfopila inferna]|uniref:flagellar basal body P-ring protein FlgI n=1 Tax=Desulfopila inferna TaxID=468528 RepID=UPI0019629636|nr:flagellar basal body P-ring protein FlgI [Desulfopila inferna]MBM9602997.1 flagellar basal body P-ring protein FlgI [Desulfopila inferna]
MKFTQFSRTLLITITIFFIAATANSARIKDIANLHGVRTNQLIGYGLVTGLNGTGDDMKKTTFTLQAIYNMMVRNGISIDPKELDGVKIDNIAAVMVTATLPPFSRPGSRIDVLVSSMGDADSLAGGTLLMTPLKGADDNVYAVAQGPLSIGAFSFGGKAAKAQKNHPTVGRISNGAIIENTVPVELGEDGKIVYQLNNADFTTATRMSDSINRIFGKNTAFPNDSGTVIVHIPESNRDNVVSFVSEVESIEILSDSVARVVVNERTGTIVMGKDVKLSTVAVSHGNLSLVVKEYEDVVQPNPLGEGDTVVTRETSLEVVEEEGRLTVLDLPHGVSIGEIASALNAIGATPRDLIAIFQAIKASGSMQGELIIL